MNAWTIGGDEGDELLLNGRFFAYIIVSEGGEPLSRDEKRELLEALNGRGAE